MEFDYDAEVEVRFAEDLTHADVAPLLDALASAGVFKVRSSRVGWSGPAGGGPEVAMYLVAAATLAGGAFVTAFCAELGKDAYKETRAALGNLMKRLRERSPEERRAVIPLVLVIGEVRVCVGRMFHEVPAPDEWSDDWLLERLRRSQEIVDAIPSVLEERSRDSERTADEMDPCEFWLDSSRWE